MLKYTVLDYPVHTQTLTHSHPSPTSIRMHIFYSSFAVNPSVSIITLLLLPVTGALNTNVHVRYILFKSSLFVCDADCKMTLK